jgi:hypothetical protein
MDHCRTFGLRHAMAILPPSPCLIPSSSPVVIHEEIHLNIGV